MDDSQQSSPLSDLTPSLTDSPHPPNVPLPPSDDDNMAPASDLTECTTEGATCPPTLTAGRLTPELIQRREAGCLAHFDYKKIAAEDQVARATPFLLDPLVQNWYLKDRPVYNTSSFAEFMIEFRNEFLNTNWAVRLQREIGQITQDDRPFTDFANEIMSKNAILLGTTYHMDDALLRFTLDQHMNKGLARRIENLGVNNTIASRYGARNAVRQISLALRSKGNP